MHLTATVRLRQVQEALKDGPKTMAELRAAMGDCSERLVRLYVQQLPEVIATRVAMFGTHRLQYALRAGSR